MYRLVTSLQLGITGVTDLRAQLLLPDGSNSGSAISTGFTSDLGGGQYLWDCSSYPDGFYGAVAFYRASAPGTRWIHAINPQEGEYVDAKISGRMATFTYTAPDNATIASILSAVNGLISTIGAAGAGLTALPGMVWANITRTLTSGGGGATADEVAAAVWAYVAGIGRTLTAFGANSLVEFTYTLTVTNTSQAIPDARIRITTDQPGSNTVWVGTTDSFGVARDSYGNKPRLEAGTYYIWRSKFSYIFNDPDTEVVS